MRHSIRASTALLLVTGVFLTFAGSASAFSINTLLTDRVVEAYTDQSGNPSHSDNNFGTGSDVQAISSSPGDLLPFNAEMTSTIPSLALNPSGDISSYVISGSARASVQTVPFDHPDFGIINIAAFLEVSFDFGFRLDENVDYQFDWFMSGSDSTGASFVALEFLSNPSDPPNTVFASATNGTASDSVTGELLEGNAYRLVMYANLGGCGGFAFCGPGGSDMRFNFTLTMTDQNPTPVIPEPSAAVLSGLASLIVGCAVRRQNRSSSR